MIRTRASALLGLATVLAAVAMANPGEPSPRQLIEQTTDAFLTAIADAREAILEDPEHAQDLVARIIMSHVDVDTVGRWMLSKHWRTATPAQRERFVDEVRTMLVRAYATALAQYTKGDQIKYLSEHVSEDGRSAVVRARIPRSRGSQSADVVYRLHRKNEAWMLFDVTVGGVSLVTTYRSTFVTRIESQGLDGVIRELSRLNSQR